MTSIRLVAVDLDGTLLDPCGAPHEADVRALQAAARAGVVVTIVTGRLYSGTRAAAERLGLEGPVACADGSHIVRARDHVTLLHRGLSGVHATATRDALAAHGAAGFLFVEDAIVHDDAGLEYLHYVRTWSQDVRRTGRLEGHDLWQHEAGITACVAVGSQEQISRTAEAIREAVGEAGQLAVFPIRRVPGALWGMIVRAAGGTKGTALLWLAEAHGVPIEETACVGDWLNDLPMMQVAGRSFAMGQAPEEVKRAATRVLPETHETGGGIARVIREELGLSFR